MIQIFSSYFKVKPEFVDDCYWFITDVANLQIDEKSPGEYCFSGFMQGYLSTYGICSSYINILSLTEDEYNLIPEEGKLEEDELPLIEVGFSNILKRLILNEVHWLEIDLEDMVAISTKLSPTLEEWRKLHLTFGYEHIDIDVYK